jgi:purine-cytosine permease-like protein
MHDFIFYSVEYIVILFGVVIVHKYVYNRKRRYDTGSFYLSVLAATYIWIVTVSMHLLGIEAGFFLGFALGGFAVAALDTAVGFLHNSGY